MGTVHAKQADHEVLDQLRRDVFDLDSAGADSPSDEPTRPSIRLDGVKARVDRIHVEGLGRTRDDVVRLTVDELFHATDFEDVIMRTHKVRNKLESMGCFRDIGVLIDVSTGPGATPEGLEVTFSVSEMSRIVGGVNTTVSENEGNLVLGARLPNVLGRGERLQAEYSMGYRSSSNFSVTAAKPYPYRPLAPVISASVFQQSHEYPWSGYRLLDRGLLLDLSFNTSPATKHSLQWEGLVRDTAVLSKTTSFKVRESSGPVMKSGVRHVVAIDHRDDPIFPTRGVFVQFTSEVAGLGGGVAYLKNELAAQVNRTVVPDVVLSGGAALGVLHDVHGAPLADRLFLGGPTTLRGFAQRGVGPHADKQATGGAMYWAVGAHVYTPLPFKPGRGGLGELFRAHAFLNAGSLAPPDAPLSEDLLRTARVAAGAGLALRLGRAARLELNYAVPLRALPDDRTAPGLQFGVGVHFL